MKITYDPFVLPFTLGLAILLVILAIRYITWTVRMEKSDKKKFLFGIFSLKKNFRSFWEIFMECLIHQKVFKQNILLGFMHMTIAFGWFLLIVIGNIEAELINNESINPPYYPIFLKFFETSSHSFKFAPVFGFIMDLILLFILTGVTLAWIKRFYSKWFGMKKTSKLKVGDQIALYTLWFVFPLRFLAESFTSGVYHNGSFLTGTFGSIFSQFLPVKDLMYPTWWAYSFSLGLFFVSLPWSRYMHIPTEIFLIILRNYGIKTEKRFNSFSKFEVYSCSRCGICIDTCQLNKYAGINDTQSVYFLRSMRDGSIEHKKLFNCLTCGRCSNVCPVGIETTPLRISQRQIHAEQYETAYQYLTNLKPQKAEYIFFAGCMSHLTPGIKKSMLTIFNEAKLDFWFMDEDLVACCGRPLYMAGQFRAADNLVSHNKSIIHQSLAKVLVTSCPICYKTFKEDYSLNIKVMHHSEFILELINENKISIEKLDECLVYHDPCELGRGSGIYNQPREILKKIATLKTATNEYSDSLCCGGSIGNLQLQSKERDLIRDEALKILTQKNPDTLVTACPLCKKTFAQGTNINVKDIAEIVTKSMKKKDKMQSDLKSNSLLQEV